jgi:hypothetical protein
MELDQEHAPKPHMHVPACMLTLLYAAAAGVCLASYQVALKVADLGHLTSSWPVHQRWVAALEEEFFRQVRWP